MATSDIPLNCTICPKKPKFSDVSHLLTHVASKGHLSHYYKVKVRASNDTTSRELIDTYDRWYYEWKVEELMSQRMHMKDKRRNGRNRPQASRKADISQKRQLNQSSIDPQLNGLDVYAASDNQISQPTVIPDSQYGPLINLLPVQQKHKPRLHLWSTTCPSSFDSVALESSSPQILPLEQVHELTNNPMPTAFMGGDVTTDLFEETGLAAESTKLKGILWPGMDIFDAATPDMKRKRNQKKDGSVVEHLHYSSLMVEPTEMIFTPQGALKKQRPISGQVEYDSSPYKLDIPSPPRRRSTRRPLAEQDPNNLSVVLLPESLSRYYVPAADLERPHDKMEAHPKNRSKRNFVVYQDEPDDPFYQPAEMRYLTSAFNGSEQISYTSDVGLGNTSQSISFENDFFGIQNLPYYGLQDIVDYLPDDSSILPPYHTSKEAVENLEDIGDENDDFRTILMSSEP